MKLAKSMVVLLALVMCASCGSNNSNPNGGADIQGGQISMPSKEDLPSLRVQAMQGSAAAAMRLSLWHMTVMEKEDDLFWTRIAAENGSAVAQYNLALKLLADQKSDLNMIRAKFWLEKAAANGDQYAKEKLDSIK
jgi:TPR repeat protein